MQPPPSTPRSCQQRHHAWGPDGKCLLCPARRKRAARADAPAVGADGAAAFAAALNLSPAPVDGARAPSPPVPSAGATPAHSDPTAPAQAPSPEKTDDFWPFAAGVAVDGYVGLCALAGRKWRKANEPDGDAVDMAKAALARKFSAWFPEAELSDSKRLLMAAVVIPCTMYVGAEKVAPKPLPKPASDEQAKPAEPTKESTPAPPPAPAPAAATTNGAISRSTTDTVFENFGLSPTAFGGGDA